MKCVLSWPDYTRASAGARLNLCNSIYYGALHICKTLVFGQKYETKLKKNIRLGVSISPFDPATWILFRNKLNLNSNIGNIPISAQSKVSVTVTLTPGARCHLAIHHNHDYDKTRYLPFFMLRDGVLDGDGVETLERVEPLQAIQLEILEHHLAGAKGASRRIRNCELRGVEGRTLKTLCKMKWQPRTRVWTRVISTKGSFFPPDKCAIVQEGLGFWVCPLTRPWQEEDCLN